MLVDFSPWETADTSLRLSRKRPRNASTGDATKNTNDTAEYPSSSLDDSFPIVGSMVTTKASRRKKRTHMDSGRAVFTITSPHRVSILIEERNRSNNSALVCQESSKLQYTSRNEFVSETSKDQVHLPATPVLYDAKNDRLFALQSRNTHLTVWHAQSDPPSDLKSKGCVKLTARAVSLHLLPDGVVYGSCQDGTVFFASVEADDALIVQYLLATIDVQDGMQHAGTFVETTPPPASPTTTTMSGQKLGHAKLKSIKQQGEEEQDAIKLYQMFWSGNQLTLICRQVDLAVSPSLTLEQSYCKAATIPLIPSGYDEEKCVLRRVMLVPRTSGYSEMVTINFVLEEASAKPTTKSTVTCYGCTIHLGTGNLARPPFSLPSSFRNASMIGSRIMVYGTSRQVVLCDAFYGTVMHSEPLPPALLKATCNEWTLYADDTRSHLVVLYHRHDQMSVATTTFRIGELTSQSLNVGLSLAARIASSVDVSSSTSPKEPRCLGSVVRVETTNKSDIAARSSAAEALDILRAAHAKILRTGSRQAKAGSFLEEYDRAVACMVKSLGKSWPSKEGTNGCVPAGCKVSIEDRDHENGRKRVKLINGFHGDKARCGDKCDRHQTQPVCQQEVVGDINVTTRDVLVNGRHSQHSAGFIAGEAGAKADSLPHVFVDGAVAIIFGILGHVDAQQRRSPKKADPVKQDCIVVLSKLLATGKLSARRHFVTDGVSVGFSFSQILRQLEVNQTHENRCYSPIDMMHDMMRFCADVSERHMVNMLHYMLSRAFPSDIALHLLGASHIPSSHSWKTLSERFLGLEKEAAKRKQSDTEIQRRLESIACKLVVAGTCDLFESILLYSHCNQALLCNALRQGLPHRHESSLLSRLLAKVVFSCGRVRVENRKEPKRSQNIVASAALWFPALFDSFADRLADDSDESCNSMELVKLQQNLTAAIRQTEHLMALEGSINEASTILKQAKTAKKPKTKKRKEEDNLPAYSVERLAF